MLVVIAIIGVLAAVAIPAYNGYQTNARNNAVQGSLNNAAKAVQVCLAFKSQEQLALPLQMINLDCKSDTSDTDSTQIACPMSRDCFGGTICVSLMLKEMLKVVLK